MMTVFLLYNFSYLFGTGCDCGRILLILLLWLCAVFCNLKVKVFSVIIEHASLLSEHAMVVL